MKSRFKFYLAAMLGLALAFGARAQQQPVLGVDIVQLSVLTGMGSVAYVELVNEGGGYANPPTVTIQAPAGSGRQATARAVISVNGTISRLEILDPGSGYTFNPEIVISGGGGAGAIAVAQVGQIFPQEVVNESFGSYRVPIAVTAEAVGTFVSSSFTYSFFVNGISIGVTTGPVPPGVRPTALWTPPQPGSYFITVTATDGVSTATSLAVRYFAEGTVVNSPLPGLVPQGSSVVIKADATVAQGFIQKIEFYDGATPIGVDTTIPYSIIYPVPGAVGSVHNITARATDNEGVSGTMSLPVALRIVTPITPLATSSISTPPDGAVIAIPSGAEPPPIPIVVDATSRTGRISKVETYIDGELFGTKTTFPYTFDWTPKVVGVYRIVALSYDDKSNAIASRVASVSIAAPPSVSIIKPSNNGTVIGGVPTTINAVATDSNVDSRGDPLTISSVDFFVDGMHVGSATTPSAGNIFSTTATLKRKTDEDGNPLRSTIQAIARNSGDINGVSGSISVAVTEGGGSSGGGSTIGEAPTIEVTWPAANTALPVNKPVLVVGKAADTDGNVVSVQFFANNTSLGSTDKYPYNLTWTPGSLGFYALTAKVTDSDGNVVTSEPLGVTVIDPAPNAPTVQISAPANAASIVLGSSQTLRANATDAVSVQSVQFFVNGDPVGAADSAYPFEATWRPQTPGVYTISARALNASGNPGTSPAVMVVVSEGASEAVFTGTYTGGSEAGNFAVIATAGDKATFLAHSTTAGAHKSYRYTDVPLDAAGGFALSDSAGKLLLSGSAGGINASGHLDGGRLTFIGLDTSYFPATPPVAASRFSGALAGRTANSLIAVVGADRSLMLHVEEGAFSDAGSGKIAGTGAFSFASARGNRFEGKLDPVSGLLTGTLSGSNGGNFTASPSTGSTNAEKISGKATEVGSNITLPTNGRTYDQVLLEGARATVAADPGQVTRISFVDLNDDIVQVEFSGAGRLAIELDNASGPKPAANYNQPGVSYMKGHARLLVTGADETTNVSIFSVGPITALTPALFRSEVTYDGVADIAQLAILSTNGKFGGIRAANTSFLGAKGIVGISAPGVEFVGPVFVGDITASETGNPMLLLGSSSQTRITGGNLWQANGRAVQVSGVSRLEFVDGMTSRGTLLPAQIDQSRLEENGVDVTVQIVVNPGL